MRIYHSNFKNKGSIHEDLIQGIHLYIPTEEIARYCRILRGNNYVRKMRFFPTKNGIVTEYSPTDLRRLW